MIFELEQSLVHSIPKSPRCNMHTIFNLSTPCFKIKKILVKMLLQAHFQNTVRSFSLEHKHISIKTKRLMKEQMIKYCYLYKFPLVISNLKEKTFFCHKYRQGMLSTMKLLDNLLAHLELYLRLYKQRGELSLIWACFRN